MSRLCGTVQNEHAAQLESPELKKDVVQTGRTRGTVRANGASFDIPEVHVWELRDGKVVRYQVYIDTPAMLDALRR